MYKIWSSVLDGCSCSLCAKLDGSAVPLDEPFVVSGRSVLAPPLHEGCRCSLEYSERPAPAPMRDLDAYCRFAEIAKGSDDFFAAVNGYHAAVFFLRRLSGYSDAELDAAGISPSRSLSGELAAMIACQDAVVDAAIDRAHGRVVADAASLKTEKGRAARADQLLQLILSSQMLSPENYQHLRVVFEGVSV